MRAGLDQKIDQGRDAGEQNLARRTPLAPVGDDLAVQWRDYLPEPGLELEQRLQILLGKPLLGELRRDGVQAFESESEFVLAPCTGLPKRL